jgi:CTP synthase (UTP-ammonia lyase)
MKASEIKLPMFCNVSPAAVIESIDTDSIYKVPLLMRDEKLDLQVLKKTRMSANCMPELACLGMFPQPLAKSVKYG